MRRLWLTNFLRFGGQIWSQKRRFHPRKGGAHIAAALADQLRLFWWPDLVAKTSISSEGRGHTLQRLWLTNFLRFGGQIMSQKRRFRPREGVHTLQRLWLTNFVCFGGQIWSQKRRFRPREGGAHIATALADQLQPFRWPNLVAKTSIASEGRGHILQRLWLTKLLRFWWPNLVAKSSISSKERGHTLKRLWLTNFLRFGGQIWSQKRRFRPRDGGAHIATALADQLPPFRWPNVVAKTSISSKERGHILQRLWLTNFLRFGGQIWSQKRRFRPRERGTFFNGSG